MTKLTEDTKLEILNDHYKETVADFKKTSKSRDTNFLIVLVLLGVMAFQFVSPDQSQSVLVEVINSSLSINATLSVNLLGSLVWAALLFAAIRYFQAVINLEKQYNYSHDLEELISKDYKGEAFTREGKSYLTDYPLFSTWVHFIYRTLFPLILAVIITIKIVGEWLVHSGFLPLMLNTVIYLALIISIALYVYSLRNTEKHTEKDVSKK